MARQAHSAEVRAKARRDWLAIKKAYVEGEGTKDGLRFHTLEELEARFGVPLSTLKKRCAKEDWTTQRNLFASKVEQKRQERKSDALASQAAQFDHDVFTLARKGLERVQGLLDAGELGDNAVWNMGRALDKFQRAGRLALGEKTEEVGVDVSGARDRLLSVLAGIAERRRARAATQST